MHIRRHTLTSGFLDRPHTSSGHRASVLSFDLGARSFGGPACVSRANPMWQSRSMLRQPRATFAISRGWPTGGRPKGVPKITGDTAGLLKLEGAGRGVESMVGTTRHDDEQPPVLLSRHVEQKRVRSSGGSGGQQPGASQLLEVGYKVAHARRVRLRLEELRSMRRRRWRAKLDHTCRRRSQCLKLRLAPLPSIEGPYELYVRWIIIKSLREACFGAVSKSRANRFQQT